MGICSILIGFLIATTFQPVETTIELNQPTLSRQVRQGEGTYSILYSTTGPVLLSFDKDCDGGKASLLYYCGIELNYNGKGGIIDLKIPAGLANEIDPVQEALVSYFYPIQIPFQKLNHDDYYSVIRIEVPPNYDKIILRDGIDLPPLQSFLLSVSTGAVCIFFVIMPLVLGLDHLIKKIGLPK